MNSPSDFQPVNRDEPCVICGKGDWCRRSADGAHECHRVHEDYVNGYGRIATTPDGHSVYRRPQDRPARGRNRQGPHKSGDQPITSPNLADESRRFQTAISLERKTAVAQQLGVSAVALDNIRIGRAEEHDLKRLRASGAGWKEDFPPVVSSFPECDAVGAVIGICFRADDGRKGSPSGKVGAKRGLIIPSTLATRPDPVLLVEGSSDVAACETLGLASVGRPSNSSGGKLIGQLLASREVLVVGEYDQNPAGTWPGRDGANKLATQLAKTWKRTVQWALPTEGHKDVRAYLQHLVANGLDMNDEQACHEAGQRFVESLQATATEVDPPVAASNERKSEDGAREVVLALCEASGDHFFHDEENKAFVLVREKGISRTFPVRSREYGLFLGRRYYRATGSGLPSAAKTEAIATLEAIAIFDGPEESVWIRIGEHEGKVVLDLCDEQWRVVIIDENGWKVVRESPIRFRRTRGMLPLPVPTHGGSIDDLREFMNVTGQNDFVLICGFILGCFNPHGPYAILLVNGEQGSAKSTLCRIVRALIDPNKAPLRTEPKDDRDLAIAANNAWMLGLDNMSQVTERVSNALCRLATGGGFATRELYSDSDETIFDAKRPILINGIGDVATRSDLVDRAIRVTLPTIPEDRRRTERGIWSEFERLRPSILGALLDCVSMALRNRDAVDLATLPRMADAACWMVAAEPACPWEQGSIVAALNDRRREADEMVIEASPLATAVRDRIERHGDIEGTATVILELLSGYVGEKVLKLRDWPKAAPAFGTKLREAAPNFRRLGIEVLFGRSGGRRNITIRRAEKPPETLSLLSSPSHSPPEAAPDAKDTGSIAPVSDGDLPFDDSDPSAGDSETPTVEGPGGEK